MGLIPKALSVLVSAFLMWGCSLIAPQSNCTADWSGPINFIFLAQAKADLAAARGCEVYRVRLYSPGGGVFDTLEVLRVLDEAKKSMVVEMHGRTEVASGATFVLAAGTRGHRYIHPQTLTLVHGIQANGSCGLGDDGSDMSRVLAVLRQMLVNEYSRLTGLPEQVVTAWLDCDNTQIGDASLLIKLGIADHLES